MSTWILLESCKSLLKKKVTVIPTVAGALGVVPKSLEKNQEELEIGKRIVIIQTTELFKPPRILRKVLDITGDLLSLRLLWKNSRLKVV